MPTMANITVKNAAAADVVYTGAVPSAGDRSPARWTANAASAVLGFRPVFQVTTRDNGRQSARVLTATLRYPIIEVISGVPTQTALFPLTFEATLPTNVDGTLVNDGFIQGTNLLVSALFRQMAAEGYAAT